MQHSKHNYEFSRKRTWYVLILTIITMVGELIAGVIYKSITLIAYGLHMGTHVIAFIMAIFAYQYAKKHSKDPNFNFGTGKISVLGGFTSSIALGVVAFIMIFEALHRLISPQHIHFDESLFVLIFSLLINTLSAFLLHEKHDAHHYDYNLKAAYLHVLADVLTASLAIIALTCGKFFHWSWCDPIMGIISAFIIISWSYRLALETIPILLDCYANELDKKKIINKVESKFDQKVDDLRIWHTSPEDCAMILSLKTKTPKPIEDYQELLKEFKMINDLMIVIQ